ncbi:hypothetical protein [Azospirillum argentinense]
MRRILQLDGVCFDWVWTGIEVNVSIALMKFCPQADGGVVWE